MRTAFNKWLDRCVIRAIRPVGAFSPDAKPPPISTPLPPLDFPSAQPPADWTFATERQFRFTSSIQTRWSENNTVVGQFFRCAGDWRKRPVAILVHGWNAELCYRFLFPCLAFRLTRSGMSAAMLELPYHGHRRPALQSSEADFISENLFQTWEAVRQAVADVRGVLAWFRAQGCPGTGLWGFSLGAWVSGLILSCDPDAQFGVLLTPLVDVELALGRLPFCAPIHEAFGDALPGVDRLNLSRFTPAISEKNILLIESRDDLFVAAETVEELWRAWNKPEIWRFARGHISILLSPFVLERAVRWILRTAAR